MTLSSSNDANTVRRPSHHPVLLAGAMVAVLGIAGCSVDEWRDNPRTKSTSDGRDLGIEVSRESVKAAETEQALGKCRVTRPGGQSDDPLNLTEAAAVFDCLRSDIMESLAASENGILKQVPGWEPVSDGPFPAAYLGPYYFQPFANERALGEDGFPASLDRAWPVGAIVTAVGFTVDENGIASPGPAVIVEKLNRGPDPVQGNWRYIEASLDGSDLIQRNDDGSGREVICPDCSYSKTDMLYLSLFNNGKVPFTVGRDPITLPPLGVPSGVVQEEEEGELLDPNLLGDAPEVPATAPVPLVTPIPSPPDPEPEFDPSAEFLNPDPAPTNAGTVFEPPK